MARGVPAEAGVPKGKKSVPGKTEFSVQRIRAGEEP
jgi:hypothetical protein